MFMGSEAERDLKDLKKKLKDNFHVGPLIKKCCTLDQGKAVITFLDAILDKTLGSTVALLAGRGRGMYSNIFVTAPNPENLKTLFEFVSKGLNMLEYKVCLEGKTSRASATQKLKLWSSTKFHGNSVNNSKIKDFPRLSGARIVLIATHPNAMKVL
ncbi:unnamed protein product [Lactuca virosa]|uniref:TcmA/NAT10 helicase domain-containing protein n=1 Tax=Lactuca virosa TaxID=75947 RepID=A0AAU9M5R0_9ASTR|nr:unnamed protein product [Lactuca virosa]